MIPEAAVEAVARALTVESWGVDIFDGMTDDGQNILRQRSAIILAAAAPHIAERAYNAGHLDGMNGAPNTNPYRSRS